MDRRRFLRVSSATLGAAAAPAWLASAFAQDSERPEHPPRPDLGAALDRARTNGKPLLVALVPESWHDRRTRGELLGSWLNLGDSALFADLALCEFVCATIADVRATFEVEAAVLDGPLALVETDGDAPSVAAIRAPVDEEDRERLERKHRDEFFYPIELERELRRASLTRSLRAGLVGDAATIRRRTAQCLSSLDERLRDRIGQAWGEPARLALADVDRAAALVRFGIDVTKSCSDATRRRIAEAASARLKRAAPSGARWAIRTVCGAHDEGGPGFAAPCGTGFVCDDAKRFLRFFVER